MRRALPIVAAALGRKFGVQVVMEGNQAKTDGNVIVLPVLADEDVGVEDVVWGYQAHESAHVRHTDFDTFSKAATSEIRKQLLNTIEDVRIEDAMSREYPGTRETIGKTVLHVLSEGGFNPDTATPAGILASHILLKLRNEVLGQEMLAPLANEADAALRKTFPKGVVTRLNGMLTEVRELGSTTDALRLTDGILRMLKEEHDKAKKEEAKPSGQQRKNGKGKKFDDPKAAPDNASSAADGGEQDQDGKSPSGAGASSGKSDQESQDSSKGGQEGKSKDAKTDVGQSAGDGPGGDPSAIMQALEAKAGDIPQDVFQQVAELLNAKSTEGIRQHGWTRLPKAEVADNNDNVRQQILTEARANSNRLRAQLTGLVQASREERRMTKRSGRRLNHRRIHRVLLGDARVFESVTENPLPNTAVHLLVDVSGSMDEQVPGITTNRCDLALDSAVALSVALESIHGVNPAVIAFPGYRTMVQVLQRHGERISRIAGRFQQGPRGGTPMYEALQFASCQTLLQPEPRKLLIVLTDGSPSKPEQVRELVRELEQRAGMEVYGIGIATMAVNNLFRKHHVINDVRELRTALFAIAREVLLAA